MGDILNIFTVLLYNPLLNILIAFYHLLLTLHIPYPLGFSIILLTVVIRLILWPFVATQLHASKKMQALTPHLTRLKEKHKGDNAKIQQETMKLYKEHGVNPLAGCLPMLIQFPVLITLYNVLGLIVSNNGRHVIDVVNKAVYFPGLRLTHTIDQHFFGLPLGGSPSKLLTSIGVLVLLVPVITAGLQFIQSKMMFGTPVAAPQAPNKKEGALQKIEKKIEKKEEDFAQAFQSQSLFLIPLLIGFSSFNFPLGLSLYWNTFTIFGIIQQYQIAGLGGLNDWIKKIKR